MTRPPAPLPLPLPRLETTVIDALVTLYRELAADLRAAGAECDGCGRCCHLTSAGHELWLTDVELALLVAEGDRRAVVEEGCCPYLEGERCTVHGGRALGCRLYHCQLPAETLQRISEQYHRRLLEFLRRAGREPAYGELLASLDALVASDEQGSG